MTSQRARYRAIEEQVFAHYRTSRYAEGAALARQAVSELPGWRADLAHLAACLLTLDGRPGEAYAELAAAFEAGAWWHRRILIEDDDLADVRRLDGFAALVEAAHARALAAGEHAAAPVLRQPDGPAVGVLVALHGAGEDATDAAKAWAPAASAGWLVLAVESTQRNTPTYRSWPDYQIGVRDVEAALGALSPDQRALPLVAAGFSAGGRQALRWALAKPAAGFVAVAPAVRPEQLDPDVVSAAAERGLTGSVLLGVEDDDVRDGARASVTVLRAGGLDCALHEVPGLGHAFPDDFVDRLRGVLRTGR